ncbi:MAG: hypothetical protein ABEJ98_01550 [Candidatus Nanohaloarchaea archaeon]
MSEAQERPLPEQLYDKTWKPGMLCARKRERLVSEEYDEVYVEDLDVLPGGEGYAVKYREGRLGPSETVETFEEEDAALEFVHEQLEPETST